MTYLPLPNFVPMTRLSLLTLCLLGLCWTSQAHPPDSPTYEEVVQTYFARYKAPEHIRFLRFSRRPSGYFIERLNSTQQAQDEALIYSFEEEQYRTPSYPFGEPINKDKTSQYPQSTTARLGDEFLQTNNSQYMQRELERQPYHGYNGWYKDVITAFEEPSDSLTAWKLHALARAYQAQSSALLSNNFGFADPVDNFGLPPGRGHMSEEQINTYLEWIGKTLDTYKQLLTLDPDFVTPVGTVHTKYSSEVVDAFLTLLRFQNEETARRVLQEDLFDPYTLQISRNFLETCPQDALLYTWGDVDTYSLYYLQAVEGFRTDVILVNLSLIITPSYQQMLLSGPLGAQPLQTGFPPIFFDQLVVGQLNGPPRDDAPMPVRQFFDIANDPDAWQVYEGSPYYYLVLPSLSYQLPVPDYVPTLNDAPIDHIELSNPGSLMFPYELTFIDFLVSNNWERPICFAPTVLFNQYDAWKPHLVWEGMILRWMPHQEELNTALGSVAPTLQYPIRVEESYDLWMENYQSETQISIAEIDRLPYYQSTLLPGIRLLHALADEGETKRVRRLGLRLQELYPNSQQAWGGLWVYIAKTMARGGCQEEAEAIGLTISDNLAEDRLSEFDERNEGRLLASLSEMAKEYEMEELRVKCEERQ